MTDGCERIIDAGEVAREVRAEAGLRGAGRARGAAPAADCSRGQEEVSGVGVFEGHGADTARGP